MYIGMPVYPKYAIDSDRFFKKNMLILLYQRNGAVF